MLFLMKWLKTFLFNLQRLSPFVKLKYVVDKKDMNLPLITVDGCRGAFIHSLAISTSYFFSKCFAFEFIFRDDQINFISLKNLFFFSFCLFLSLFVLKCNVHICRKGHKVSWKTKTVLQIVNEITQTRAPPL